MVLMWRRAIALVLVLIALGLTSCGGDRDVPVVLLPDNAAAATTNRLVGAIAEVSPPERIQQLKPYLDVYAPQVRIATPDPEATVNSTTVQVEVQVRDFSIYKDPSLGLGPHLHLFLDDRPHQAIYDVEQPITLENLSPGTHILRLLAVRPWGESFKNEGAYDQVVFNVFAPSPQNNPDDSQPVLTYNQPQDSYGAEPILLDFHLDNAPPHLVAQADDAMADWRIRCTVSGESFIFDRWQPIYLKGFQPGKNWLKLELIDENGNLIDNALNTTVRVIDYQPGGNDSLSRLVRGEIPLVQAKVLIDASYEPPTLPLEESVEPIAPPTASDESSAVDNGATVSPTVADENGASGAGTDSDTPAESSIADEDGEPAKLTESSSGDSPSARSEIDASASTSTTTEEDEDIDVEVESEAIAPATSSPTQLTPKEEPAATNRPAAKDVEAVVEEPLSQSGTDIESMTIVESGPDSTSPARDAAEADKSSSSEMMLEQKLPSSPEDSSESVPESNDETPSREPDNNQETTKAEDNRANGSPAIPTSDDAEDADILANRPAPMSTPSAEAAFPSNTDTVEPSDDAEVTSEDASPDTNLKTLENNADLI